MPPGNANCPPSASPAALALAALLPGLEEPQAFKLHNLSTYNLHVSRHTRLDSLVQPLFSCAAASWPRLNFWDRSIHAFFFCNTHQAGGPGRVALEIHRRAGVLSGCPFITDIRMSGTSESPSTAGLCAADSLELRRGDKIKGSTGAPCI